MYRADSIKVTRPLFQVGEGGAVPTSAHQLEVEEIKPEEACRMNSWWHSRLPLIHWSNVVRNTHYVCYVARYDGFPYAIAIWSTPVAANRMKDGNRILELRRLAIAPNAPKNTASWMIALMVRLIRKKFPRLTKLISYQDTEVHKGTIYRAAGWTAGNTSAGISWTTKNRKRSKEQTLAPKIRWEKEL